MSFREGLPYILLTAIFVLDLMTPLGVADGMLYAIILVYACFFGMRDRSILLAGISTALIVAGYLLSSVGADSLAAIVNRAYSLALVWGIAIITASTSVVADVYLPQLRYELKTPIQDINANLDRMMNGACGHCDSPESRQQINGIRAAVEDLKGNSERLLAIIASRLPAFARGLSDRA
ncbi:MAG: hypothetical protein H3C38_03440 [Rhodospirillales bacterium]|nr:hypothetical protein [Rhodospirillales bacterium]